MKFCTTFMTRLLINQVILSVIGLTFFLRSASSEEMRWLRYEFNSLFGRSTSYLTDFLYHVHQQYTQPSLPPMSRCSTPATTSDDHRPTQAITFDDQPCQPLPVVNSNNIQSPLLTTNSTNSDNYYFKLWLFGLCWPTSFLCCRRSWHRTVNKTIKVKNNY